MSDETREHVDDGGPAFPTAEVQRMRNVEGGFNVAFKDGAQGMSLRDWFAGQALTGCWAHEGADANVTQFENTAKRCYHMADAMLAARR